MNPIIIEPQVKSKTEVQAESNLRQEYKYLGSITLKPGMKLFKFNPHLAELKEVELKKTKDVDFNKQKVKNDQALYDPKCIYFQALNMKNAEKKATKMVIKMIDKIKEADSEILQ